MSKNKTAAVALLMVFAFLVQGRECRAERGQSSTGGPIRVAIVGAGVGGGAAAYYLKNFSQSLAQPLAIETTVYESLNRVGGRLYAVEIGGQRLNVGGDAWAQVNWYVRELVASIQLPLDNGPFYAGNGLFAMYEEPGVVYPHPEQLLTHPISDVGMLVALAETEKMLAENYRQRGFTPYANISTFLQAGEMVKFTERTTRDYLLSRGVSNLVIEQVVGPLCKVIYDQLPTIHSFAGLVSVLSVTSPAYSAAGGNDNLPRTLLQQSGATVLLEHTVLSIGLAANSSDSQPQYLVRVYDNVKGVATTQTYDAVIIAAPLEWTTINLELEVPYWAPRAWVEWHVSLVEATGLQPSYFLLDPVPDCLGTTLNSSAPFAKCCVVAASNRSGYKIYSLFSQGRLSDPLLDRMFISRQSTFQYAWPFTFPILPVVSNPDNFQPIILHSRLYSNNAMESVASAMECSVISARNAVLSLLSSYST